MYKEIAKNLSKKEMYEMLNSALTGMLGDSTYNITLLANTSALLFNTLPEVNWVGFYLLEGNELLLGPFQGLPACTQIEIGKGVCGTSVNENRTIRVQDVHSFPGHIACDGNSNSEIVIPVFLNDKIYAVLDIDSPITNRFDEVDQVELENIVHILEKHLVIR